MSINKKFVAKNGLQANADSEILGTLEAVNFIGNLDSGNIVGIIEDSNLPEDLVKNTTENQAVAGQYAIWSSETNIEGISGIPWNDINDKPTITSGSGLNGGGTLFSDVTLSVDGTVVRTTGDQSIDGVKDFTDGVQAASYGGDGVTQSATDTTAGRILKVGDFGYGVEQEIAGGDANDITTPGKYNFSSGGRPANLPVSTGGVIEVYYDRFGIVRQTFYPRTDPDQFMRESDGNTVFSDWVRVYHTGNLVGTVSQSGGVPTGAVIERGSNANGEYVRFADGTQIAWHEYDDITTGNGAGAIFRSGFSFYDLPVNFSGFRAHCVQASSATAWGSPMASGFRLYSYEVDTFDVRVVTIGRWL